MPHFVGKFSRKALRFGSVQRNVRLPPRPATLAVGVAVLISLAAASSRASEATAAPEERKVYWTEPDLVLKVDSTFLMLPYAEEALTASLAAWQDQIPGLPTVVVEYPTTSAPMGPETPGNTIRVAYEYEPRLGRALAITLITRDAATGKIYDADILVSPFYVFTDTTADSSVGHHGDGSGPLQEADEGEEPHVSASNAWVPVYDLQNVMTHEIGHWFGLDENFEEPDSTMFAFVDPQETIKRDLSVSDINRATALYQSVEAENAVDGGGCGARIARSNPVFGSPGWVVSLFALAGLTLARRRAVVGQHGR